MGQGWVKPQRKAAGDAPNLGCWGELLKIETVQLMVGVGGRRGREREAVKEGAGGTDIIQHTETCQDGIYFCSVREYNRALPALSIAVLK